MLPRHDRPAQKLRSLLHTPPAAGDREGWDQYWADEVRSGPAQPMRYFVRDDDLVDAMRAHGLQSVVCLGNGLSQEPAALARAGFDVTVIEISPTALEYVRTSAPRVRLLDAHIGDRAAPTPGRLTWVEGDLCDPALCPGPFDVVIERQTLQLWPDGDRETAIAAAVSRLASRGLLVSEARDATWRPPSPVLHALAPSFHALGLVRWAPGALLDGRAVWLQPVTSWPGGC